MPPERVSPGAAQLIQMSVQLLTLFLFFIYLLCCLLPATIKSFVLLEWMFVKSVKATRETSLGRTRWRKLGR